MRRVGALFAALSSTALANVYLEDDVEGAVLLQMRSSQKQPTDVVTLMGGDAASACSNVQELDFSNVKNNNLDGSDDGDKTLVYGGVITKEDGTIVDLVITSDNYSSKKGNSKNGANHNGVGMLNLDCGSQSEFIFNFVDAATNGATLPTPIGGNVLLNFLDIDQGKQNNGREQVMLCGVTNAILSANTELEKIVMDDCATVTSGVHGRAADNPTTQQLTPLQKGRAAAFIVGSASSFGVTISVDKCFGNRGVMFGGKQTAMCPFVPQVYTPPMVAVTQPPVAIETTPEPIIHVDPVHEEPQPMPEPEPPVPRPQPVSFQPPIVAVTQPPLAIETTPEPIIHVDPVPTQPPQLKSRPAPVSFQPPIVAVTQPPVAIETTPEPIIHVDPVPPQPPTDDGEDEPEEDDTTGFCPAHRCGNQFGKACCVRRNGSANRTSRPNRRLKNQCTRNNNVWCRKGGRMAKKRSVDLADFQ